MIQIAAAIAAMRAKGLSADDILDIVEAMAAAQPVATAEPVRDARQERNARYYEARKSTPRLQYRDWFPLRNSILERDEYRCTYCGDTEAPLCADHVVPLSRGGSNEPNNLVCACMPCNSSKSDRLLSEWRGRYQ